MNLIQRLACKVFRIKQSNEVVNINYNDPSKCDTSGDISHEQLSELIDGIKSTMSNYGKITVGASDDIKEIRFVPLQTGKSGLQMRKSALQSKTYVIELIETECGK